MKESQDIKMFKRFQDSFRKWSGHFRILEQRIPVEEQMEYFKYAEKLRKKEGRENVSETDLSALQSELNDPDVSVSHKKYLLALLASLHLVKAYRIVEEYAEAPDPEMANWAYMALMESRIVLESDLSDEKQILISTGMGGKGEKLRFYVLILANELKPFQDYQRKIVEREFPYQLEKADCEIEQLTIGEQYVAMVFLIPVLAEIKQVIERVINECNEYGNFLSSSFTITNVKELSEEEVHEVIKKNERDSRTGR